MSMDMGTNVVQHEDQSDQGNCLRSQKAFLVKWSKIYVGHTDGLQSRQEVDHNMSIFVDITLRIKTSKPKAGSLDSL
jgi:hypothetical protein